MKRISLTSNEASYSIREHISQKIRDIIELISGRRSIGRHDSQTLLQK